jgi:hypothetical protein
MTHKLTLDLTNNTLTEEWQVVFADGKPVIESECVSFPAINCKDFESIRARHMMLSFYRNHKTYHSDTAIHTLIK